MIDLSKINEYSLQELATALQKGEYSLKDFKEAGLSKDKFDALFPLADFIKQGASLSLVKLLADMKENPWLYTPDLMRILLNGQINEAVREYIQQNRSDMPYADFVLEGGQLEVPDLTYAGVVPDNFIYRNILAPTNEVAPISLNDLGGVAPEGTDIYIVGAPGSGKTLLEAALLFKIGKDVRLVRHPQDEAVIGKIADFYRGSLYSLFDLKNVPYYNPRFLVGDLPISLKDTVEKKAYPLNLIEIDGDAMEIKADRCFDYREFWKEFGAPQLLENDGRKILFFVLDYSIIANKNATTVTTPRRQIRIVEKALEIFTNDGPDQQNPSKDCTMSKVDAIAIIMTKCDLMGVDTSEERLEIAKEYITENCSSFLHRLTDVCKQYKINPQYDYRPYVIPFSIGKFYVGNNVVFDENEATPIIDFITEVVQK